MLDNHEGRLVNTEKNNMEMKTDLKWIMAVLIEIKASLANNK